MDRKEYNKQYYQKNKEKKAEYNKLYNQNNKEKTKEYKKSDKSLKNSRIYNWRKREVLDNFNDNYETLYKIYLSVKFCDICNCELNQEGEYKTTKCLDHCHNSGYFRNIVCHSCNSKIR